MNTTRSTLCASLVILVLILPGVAQVEMDLHARLRLGERTLDGVASVTVPESTDQMVFLLLANLGREPNPHLGPRAMDDAYPSGFEPSETIIHDVVSRTADGERSLPFRLMALPPAWQTYSLEQGLLVVDLSEGERCDHIDIEFTTTIPRRTGDEGIHDGVLTWRFGWYPVPVTSEDLIKLADLMSPITTASVPLYFPVQSVSATIEVRPDVVLAVGADRVRNLPATAAAEPDEDAWERVHVSNQSPVRTIALAAGTDYARYILPSLSIPIEVVYRSGHEAAARLYATYAVEILADYEERFGPYPHRRLVLVEHPGQSGLSLAADGIVWLSGLFFTHRDVTLPGILDRVTEYILAHEIAHQWFGLGTTPDLAAENWLSEGLAQYLSVSYFERHHDAFAGNLLPVNGSGLIEELVSSQFGFLNLREHQIELPYLISLHQGFDEPLVRPLSQVEYDNASAVRLYDKGYLVARAIASAIGEETFDRGLRQAAQQFRGERLTTAALRATLEDVSGQSLTTLFDTWVLGAERADYQVVILDRDSSGDGHRTTVRVRRDGGAPQPVTVRATLRSGEIEDHLWDGEADEQVLVLETEGPVRRVSIDPDHRLPDADRLNNHDPVKLVVATQANAFPLDAYLIQTDASSGGVTISYLDRTRFTLSERSARVEVVRGRNHRLAAAAQLFDGDLAGALAYTYLGYGQVDTGSPSAYWEPQLAWTASVRREVYEGSSCVVLGIESQKLPSLAYGGRISVALDVTPSAAGRLIVRAFDELRLFPTVYLQGIVSVGVGFGALPPPLTFDLEEIHSLGRHDGWQWTPKRIGSQHKLAARLSIEFPTGGDLPFNLVNVAMVDGALARPFVSFGATWTSLGSFGDTTPHMEAGLEAIFDISAIGGLLPLRATIGYAIPFVGGGAPVLFFGFSAF